MLSLAVLLVTRAQAQEPDVVERISEEPAAEGDGDTLEIIDTGDGTSAAPTLAPVPPPRTDRVEVHGWVRQALELGTHVDAWHAPAPHPVVLPYYPLVSRTGLFARARYARADWLEVNLSGSLSYTLLEEGPANPNETWNGINGRAQRGALDVILGDLYIGLFTKAVDIRVGQQRVAWGRGEVISPNDVLNARDNRDPFVGETELRVMSTLLARVDFDMGWSALQLVVAPLYVPDRFDVFGSNWAAIQPDAPYYLRGMLNLLTRAFDPSVAQNAQPILQATKLPAADLTEPTAGARWTWSAGGVDVSHYYHYGFDGPFVQLNPMVRGALGAADFTKATLSDLAPLLRLIDAGISPFDITFLRRHHVGIDAATTLGPFAVRLDVAYQSKRVFYQQDFTSTARSAVQGVMSLEYQTGNPDRVLMLEGMYMRVLEPLDAPLLGWKADSVGTALLARWTLFGPFSVGVKALLGIRPLTQIIQPQLNIKLDDWVVQLGGLWLNGEPYSFGHYFRRNMEVYLKIKASF